MFIKYFGSWWKLDYDDALTVLRDITCRCLMALAALTASLNAAGARPCARSASIRAPTTAKLIILPKEKTDNLDLQWDRLRRQTISPTDVSTVFYGVCYCLGPELC
ncbi:hypothetical protein HW555_006362 [Spodoptera exigua]|uniref:Uncharacterized protein n=1 Tax=Spodoptera exigua TaxID=7107 RepID=A0A835GH58_SPOEX|nr:hypothetical protein HW555_006362 [Spodoptera exigua]